MLGDIFSKNKSTRRKNVNNLISISPQNSLRLCISYLFKQSILKHTEIIKKDAHKVQLMLWNPIAPTMLTQHQTSIIHEL